VASSLFDRYKAALRQGHVAALDGRLEDALDAYREASRLVPERALPFASQGTVLHRLDRWPDAAEAFDRALRIAPDDGATLRARAAARAERGMRSGAAEDYERLAFVLDVAGRSGEAADAAGRARELEDSPTRRALADRLAREAAARHAPASAEPPDAVAVEVAEAAAEAAAAATDRDDADADARATTAEGVDAGAADPGEAGTTVETGVEPPAEPVAVPDDTTAASATSEVVAKHGSTEPAATATVEAAIATPVEEPEPAAAESAAAASAASDDAAMAAAEAAWPGITEDRLLDAIASLDMPPAAAGRGPDGREWPASDLPAPPRAPLEGPPPDPEELLAAAAADLELGNATGALDRMLLAVAVHRAAGRLDAALDVCLQLLAIAPGDPQVHLAIANLQLDRGWTPVATEKIELLLRLTSLDGDVQAEADVHGLAAERLREEPIHS